MYILFPFLLPIWVYCWSPMLRTSSGLFALIWSNEFRWYHWMSKVGTWPFYTVYYDIH